MGLIHNLKNRLQKPVLNQIRNVFTMDEFVEGGCRDLDCDRIVLQHVRQGSDEEQRVHLQELDPTMAGHEPDLGGLSSFNDAPRVQRHG